MLRRRRMGNYILCQHKRTEHPYYIDNISTNIFSIEELCFYLYHNIYLLDETIINDGLCQWIKEELGMKSLGIKLQGLFKTGIDVESFILPIFKEIHYLSQGEYKELGLKLEQLEEQPELVRQKLKGDYLIHYGKYINGIKVYEKVLESNQKSNLGGQFKGSVYHNMGCAYAKLFQMEEALVCFQNAYEQMHTKAALKSYLYAVSMADSKEAYEQKAAELGVDAQTKAEMDEELRKSMAVLEPSQAQQDFDNAKKEKEQGNREGYYRSMDVLLERMTEEYHKNTGF